MPVVSLTKCASYEAQTVKLALEEVLRPLGLDWVKPDMKIVIKANLVSMMKPDSAATTHPSLLCALADMLTERGASVIVGDSPGGLFNSAYVNAVYSATGVKEVCSHGASLNKNFSHTHTDNPDGYVLKDFEYTTYLDDADCIINFCKLKTHGMMGMSACVKNMFGVIPGTFKPEYHYRYPAHKDFANMLIDINERFPQRLCIVDAVVGMEGNGPTMGKPKSIGALIASDSPYACDAVCAEIIGIDPNGLETVIAARERGLDLRNAEIIGNISELKVKSFELVRKRKDTSFDREFNGILGKTVGGVVRLALCSSPRVHKSACIGCKKCSEICPAKAIEMRNKKPDIDREKCIRCFCCQEFCPVGAMKVHRPIVAKLLNR